MSKHKNSDIRVPIEQDNYSICRDESKCILCGACKSACKYIAGVYDFYSLENNNDKAICIDCGQCSLVCPTSAISEVKDYKKVEEIIDRQDKIVIFQTSPSVRVALGDEFGFESGAFVEGKMVSLLRKLGANYVFDTTFGADLTIMEEANELIMRIKNGDKLPQFTSCCPAWVKYVETFYPEMLPNLSSTKSPILMTGSIIKTYFAKKMNIDPKKIINVAVTPCTAKKSEIRREEMNKAGIYHNDYSIRDMDYVITTRELALWAKEKEIDFNALEDSTYDSILGKGTGAGLIFGNTGGVMEAAIRTAYYELTGNIPGEDLLEFNPVRGLDKIKEANIKINDIDLKIAVITGTYNIRKFIKMMRENNLHYDFIEVMNCPGGCISGGGQPKTNVPVNDEIRSARIASLYEEDRKLIKRNSFENEEIKKLYQEFLKEPLSDNAKLLLHTTYKQALDVVNN